MNKTLIVNRAQCREILSIEKCVPYMKTALVAISDKQAKVLQRFMIPHSNGNMLAHMPASLMSENVTGSKVIIFPGPETAKAGTNQGIVPLFNIATGELMTIIDAELITVVRTAATSAAATDALARKDAETVAVLGCGKQGKGHAEAMLKVRDIKKIYMWDVNLDFAKASCEVMREKFPEVEFIPCESAKEAVVDADIICTTTIGKGEEPVLRGEWIKAGAHVNAVGSCGANGRELDGEAVKKATVFSDWTEACLRDAGDILLSMKLGELSELPPMVEVGEVLAGRHPGRKSADEITMFETVGISVEDIAAAKMIYEYAKENGIGTWVEI